MTLILRTRLLALLLIIPTFLFAQAGKKNTQSTPSVKTETAVETDSTGTENIASTKKIVKDSTNKSAPMVATTANDTAKTKPVVVKKKTAADKEREAEIRDSISEAKAVLAQARRDSARSKFEMRAARVRDSVLKAKERNAFLRDSTLKAKKAEKPVKVAKAPTTGGNKAKTEEPKKLVETVKEVKDTLNARDITTKSAAFNYHIIPIGELGVLIFNENTEKANSKGRYWTLTRYDKNFKEVYSKDIDISYATEMERYIMSPNGLMHVLFTQHSIAAYNSYVTSGYYQIVNINIETGKFTKIDGMLEFNMAIQSFGVVGNAAFFGGKTVPPLSEERSLKTLGYFGLGVPFLFNITFIPGSPVLVYANLETGAAKFVDIKYDGSAEVSNIEGDYTTGLANVTLSEYTNNAESKLYIISYDQQGNEKGAQVIKAKPEFLLSTGTMKSTGEEKLILGTFALDPEKEVNRKKKDEKDFSADGFYICKIGEVKPVYVQYFLFTRIKNFEKSTAEDDDYNYGLLFHTPKIEGDQYIITAELYTTLYATEGKFVTNEGGQLKKQVVPAFEKYTITHTITCGIDRATGKMLWNKLTEMDKIHTLNLSEKVAFEAKGGNNVLTFEAKNGLRRKVISASENGDGKEFMKVNNTHAGEFGEVKYRYDIQPWFDNQWISYTHPQKKNNPLSKNPKDLKPQKAVISFSKFLTK